MGAERFVQCAILDAWGSHKRLRIVRVNTGVGWFANGQPACRCHHTDAYPVHFNPKGTGDVVGLIAPTGRMLMIECKAPGGVLSKEQLVMQRVITKFGGLYVPAWSLDDVDRVLVPIVGAR